MSTQPGESTQEPGQRRAPRARAGGIASPDLGEPLIHPHAPEVARGLRRWLEVATDGVQYAVLASLVVVAVVVLYHTLVTFFLASNNYVLALTDGLDGILVVIILLDIMRTLRAHFAEDSFPVRPFLGLGVIAAVRDILSASAHLTLAPRLTNGAFNQSVMELAISVGVIIALLVALLLLSYSDEGSLGMAKRSRRGPRPSE